MGMYIAQRLDRAAGSQMRENSHWTSQVCVRCFGSFFFLVVLTTNFRWCCLQGVGNDRRCKQNQKVLEPCVLVYWQDLIPVLPVQKPQSFAERPLPIDSLM